MRVLYLHPKAWTGEYPVLRKIRELGHDVCALEEKRGLPRGKRFLDDHYADPGDGIRTLWYDPRRGWERLVTWIPDRVFRRAFDGRNLAHRMWVIAEAVRRFAPDVVMCTDGFSYAIPAAFLKRLGLLSPRLVVSYIGGDIQDCPQFGYGRTRTPMVSWLIRQSLRGIDIMRPLCDSLERILLREGADRARIVVLPIQLPRSTEVLNDVHARRAQCRASIRARYGVPPDAPLVITLSGNYRSKGIQDLAAAWASICAAVPRCHWLLCGPDDPWLEQGVRPALRASGHSARVHFTGLLRGREVCEHLAASDLHVNPTLCEGLNMATVEAAAVATPTVTSDGAGIADWVQRCDAGAVVSAGEVAELADAIIRALRAPEMLARWGANARLMAEEFRLERIAPALIELMQSRD